MKNLIAILSLVSISFTANASEQARCHVSYKGLDAPAGVEKNLLVSLNSARPGEDLAGSSDFSMQLSGSESAGKVAVSFCQAKACNDAVSVVFRGIEAKSSGDADMTVTTGSDTLTIKCEF